MKPPVHILQMNLPVYLDCHSTTPVDPRVVEAMLPCFSGIFGNPSAAINRHGQAAMAAVDQARRQVAALAGADPDEVIFTSGATESINTVLKGIARGAAPAELHIVTCETEHSAVLDTCAVLEQQGARITRLPVNTEGHLDPSQLDNALREKPTLVSIMHANNETGVIHPIQQIAAACKAHGTRLHVDAAQSFGKIPVAFRDWQIDFLSVSGHKFYAPKGVGALLIRRQNPPLRLAPLLHGGGQQRGIRSGTVNVPGAVALGAAAEISRTEMATEQARVAALRDQLLAEIRQHIPDAIPNGCMTHRLPGNLNISFPGINPQLLLPALQDKISVSSGSACKSGSPRPSYVLAAMGVPDELALASLRYGIGRFNTADEIRFAADATIQAVKEARAGL